MSSRLLVIRSLMLALVLVSSACGADVDVRNPRVTLALDFGANALLELFVFDTDATACSPLLAGELDADDESLSPHAAEARPAQGLNDGGSLQFDLEELPAEVPLTFYARATEGGAVLSHDCDQDIVIPADGHVDLQLVVRELP